MQNVQRRLDRVGKDFTKIGQNLTLGVTAPLLGLGALALDAAADFETLQARLEVALGSSSLAKKTFEELKSFTKGLAITTEEAADSYIKLKNLGLDPTIAALESYGNTAAAQGKSVNQLIEAVADAATGEFERLKEFGIKANKEGEKVTFTFQGLSTTIGNSAQDIQQYLQDLGKTTFSGALEKQANTFNGIIAILKDNIRTTLAEFGKFELDALKPIANGLNELFDRIRALSPETKKFLVIFGGIAAAVGPLLALAGTILPAIGTGFALLTGPIGLVVAGLTAIGVIIYKNWKPIKQTLIDIANYFIDLYNEAAVFRVAVEAVRTGFENIYDTASFVLGVIGKGFKLFGKAIKEDFKAIGALIKAALTGNIKDIPAILAEQFGQGFADLKNLIGEAKNDFEDLKGKLSENITAGVERSFNQRYELLADNVDTSGLEEKVADAVNKGLNAGGKGSGLRDLEKVEAVTRGITASLENLRGGLDITAPILSTINAEKLSEKSAAFLERLTEFRDRAGEIISQTAVNFVSGFAEIIGGLAVGVGGFSDVGKLLLSSLGNVLVQLGKMAIATGIGIKSIKVALASLNPVVAIAAGAALVALGSAFSAGANKLATSSGGGFSSGFSTGSGSSSSFGGVSASSATANSSGLQNVVFVIKNGDLIGAVKYGLEKNRRQGGNLKLSYG